MLRIVGNQLESDATKRHRFVGFNAESVMNYDSEPLSVLHSRAYSFYIIVTTNSAKRLHCEVWGVVSDPNHSNTLSWADIVFLLNCLFFFLIFKRKTKVICIRDKVRYSRSAFSKVFSDSVGLSLWLMESFRRFAHLIDSIEFVFVFDSAFNGMENN